MSLTGFLSYSRVNWQQSPIKSTPLSAANLNVMDTGIKNNNDMISNLRDEVTQLNSNNITNNICTNLLNPTFETFSRNGITCTNNGDGTYTINGTATDLFAIDLMAVNFTKIKGNVKLCGCLSGGSNTTYKLSLIMTDASDQQNDYGNGVIINSPNILTSNKVMLRIVVYKGTTLKGAIFKPMLTTNLNATYNDFVSYTGNTGRLNADVALLKNNLNNLNSNIDTINPHFMRNGVQQVTFKYRKLKSGEYCPVLFINTDGNKCILFTVMLTNNNLNPVIIKIHDTFNRDLSASWDNSSGTLTITSNNGLIYGGMTMLG